MSIEEEVTSPAKTQTRPRVFTFIEFGETAQAELLPWADIVLGPVQDTPEWYEQAATFDAMVIGATLMTPQLMDRIGPRLKVLARTGIGVDRVDLDAATARGIMVVNTPDGPTESTAEHAIALMLALTKEVVQSDRLTHAGEGFTSYGKLPHGLEALGAVLGLVGLGRIGKRVAEIARVLGMKVLAYDPFVTAQQASALGVTLVDNLPALLGQAQIVSLHCPAIPQTYHLLNSETLAMIKPGAFLVNVSRGSLIDETALLEALDSGHLRGAALDVYDPEPPDPNNPLLTHPKTICTSHIGSYTSAGVLRMQEMACRQVNLALRGERPTNLVNTEVWGKQRS